MTALLKTLKNITGTCVNRKSVVESARCTDASGDEQACQGGIRMPAKINRSVIINGTRKWIHANSEQEYAEKLAKLFGAIPDLQKEKHAFTEYARNWFELYSRPNIASATAVTYQRQLNLYLIPAFADIFVEDITTDDIQKLFNKMTGTKATKQKTKIVLNMILEAAVEDCLIARNPLKSRRLKLTGKSSTVTKEYTVEQMRFLIGNLDKVKNPVDRAYLAVQALHPLRLEEVPGLKWEDIDFDAMTVRIRRAVTHPTRNQPEVKKPKTDASMRVIGLSGIASLYLTQGEPDEFVFGGSAPLSYQKVRRMCERIARDTGFEEKITPIRFRTTVLTDIYDRTKDVKTAQAAAGHASPSMTMKRYAKGRDTADRASSVIDDIYGKNE